MIRNIEIDENWDLRDCGYRITRIGAWRDIGEYYYFNGNIYQHGGADKSPPELNGCLPPLPVVFVEKLEAPRRGA